MKLIAMRCPCCNGELNVERDREFCFCQYCGTKIMIDDEVKKLEGVVAVSRSYDVSNFIKRARRFEEAGDEGQALEYYNKALDVDADCREAIEGIRRIRTTVTQPNLFVRYDRTGGLQFKVDLYLNTNMVKTLSPGESASFVCTVGLHNIRLKVNEVEIDAVFNVPDKYTNGYLTFGRWGGQGLLAHGDGVRILTKKRRVDKLPGTESPQAPVQHYEPKQDNSGCAGCFVTALVVVVALLILAALLS